MTDEEFVYRSELKEKSKTAQSAKKARSARRRGCRLPADSLTKKELNKLNGPVHTIKLNEPMLWEDFREKPGDLQRQYIDAILSKYHVGPAAIAKMFGISKPYCGQYLRNLGYSFKERSKPEEAERFLRDFGIQSPVKSAPAKPARAPMGVERIVLSFVGAFTPEAIAAKLKGLFPETQEVAVTVEVAKVAKI